MECGRQSQSKAQSQGRYDTAGSTTQLLDAKHTTEKPWFLPDAPDRAKLYCALKQDGAQEYTLLYSL